MIHLAPQIVVLLLCSAAAWWAASPALAQPAPPPPPIPSESQASGNAQAAPGTTSCDRCGKVEAIRQGATQSQWTPLGSVPSVSAAGSDLSPSSVTAYRIGKDLSNQGQVMLGAAGGAVYQSRPSQRNATRWEIVVRMDDGSARSVTQNYEPLLQVGDRVRVFGTQVELLQ